MMPSHNLHMHRPFGNVRRSIIIPTTFTCFSVAVVGGSRCVGFPITSIRAGSLRVGFPIGFGLITR